MSGSVPLRPLFAFVALTGTAVGLPLPKFEKNVFICLSLQCSVGKDFSHRSHQTFSRCLYSFLKRIRPHIPPLYPVLLDAAISAELLWSQLHYDSQSSNCAFITQFTQY